MSLLPLQLFNNKIKTYLYDDTQRAQIRANTTPRFLDNTWLAGMKLDHPDFSDFQSMYEVTQDAVRRCFQLRRFYLKNSHRNKNSHTLKDRPAP